MGAFEGRRAAGQHVGGLGKQEAAFFRVGEGRLGAQGKADGPWDTRPPGPLKQLARPLSGPVVLAECEGGQGGGPLPGHEPGMIDAEAGG